MAAIILTLNLHQSTYAAPQIKESGDKAPPVPKLFRMTNNSPVYAKPSQKSKVLADVDSGTMLELVESSPRNIWIKVQDEDGNQGWVPRSLTDIDQNSYKEPDLPKIDQSSKEHKFEPAKENKKTDKEKGNYLTLGPTYIWPGALGFRVSFRPEMREREYFGITLGLDYWKNPAIKDAPKAYAIPLRISALQRSQSSIAWGPDLGIYLTQKVYETTQKSYILNGSFGYSVGYFNPSARFFVLARPGFDFFVSNHFSFEIGLGLVL